MKNLSLQSKITLWFSTSLFLIIFIMFFLLFMGSKSSVQQDTKEKLVEMVEMNKEEIEYYNSVSLEEEEGDQYIEYKGGYLEIDDDFCDYLNKIHTALYDENGKLLYGENPIATNGISDFIENKVLNVKVSKEMYYIYKAPLKGEGLEGLWLLGIVPRKEGTVLLQTIANIFLLLLPFLVVLTIAGGLLIARRSLSPIQKIRQAAEEINEGKDLSKRIGLGNGKDEIHKLASSFDSMFDRLEASFEEERQFTSDVSHELRTPISIILAQCEYVLEEERQNEDYIEAIETMQRQGFKMKRLVNQLLTFTRLEQGTEFIEKEETAISELLIELCEEQKLLEIKKIQLSYSITPNIWAEVDRGLISRIFVNLISNAYQYGKENGKIEVSLLQKQGELLLVVEDNGIGISKEDVDKVWNRFYQVENSRNHDSGSGMGLGLAMVKQIVSLHGGRVEVESAIGEGSIFRVFLPQK